MFKVSRASKRELEEIVPLFDQYRIFYGQRSDIVAAAHFLNDLFEKDENVIFLAYKDDRPIGFTQLYKTYSSVSMEPFFILNDLFVEASFRKMGIGKMLLEKAKAHCKSKGFKGLALETAYDNPAQKLYERLDWKKDEGFIHYFWKASES